QASVLQLERMSRHWTGLVLMWALTLAAAARAQSQAPAPIAITGVVQDQTGGVLPRARVELLNPSGLSVASTTADAGGQFRFDNVPAGPYELRATFEGFKPGSTRLRVGTRPANAQKLVLNLAE